MGKSINNPFAVNPEMKFGLSPDPSITRPEVRMQENRSGVQRVPQRPVYQGTQRPQAVSDQRSAGSRGYRIPAPSGAVTAGVSRPTMPPATPPGAPPAAHPAAPAHTNAPRPAAGNIAAQATGHGTPVSTPTPDNSMKVSAQDPNGAVSKGQVNAQAVAGNKAGTNMADGLKLDFSGDNLLRGFVMSEVLGRPKCLRRGRW